ncbi:hypothetical protein CYLTODRAFT_425961, partial [Cylindrobasidium torrendii FP15055 ss-10]
PPSLKTYLQGRRPPRYFLAWPYGFEDLGRRGVQGVQNIINKAAIEWYAETQQDPSRPPGPDEFFIKYKHDDEPCLFFVRITDNADENRLAFAQDKEYLAKMRKLLPEFAEEELIWIRGRIRV